MRNSPNEADTGQTTATRKRGRPRAFDREAALATATYLFWSKGYEATSIADLTQAMGIGSPSLYAAFGSKEALYAETLRYYSENYESQIWAGFCSEPTAREAVLRLLRNAAAVLAGFHPGAPTGCMVALSQVGSEGHERLGELVRSARVAGLKRLKNRLEQAVAAGEIPASVNREDLARYVGTVQGGMSLIARDGASRAELEKVVQIAMSAWDAASAFPTQAPNVF